MTEEKLKEQVKQEIQNTVEMERLAKKYLADFNNEYANNKLLYEFMEYVESVCKERMTFDNPSDDLKTLLKHIDTVYDDLLLRINDLRVLLR